MKRISKIIAIAGLCVVAAALLVVPIVSAQTNSTPAAQAVQRDGIKGGPVDEYLADALGITTEELQEARNVATDAGIQQALDEGLITQAQADQLLKRPGLRGPKLLGFPGIWGSDIDPDALLADALGISVDELQEARNKARDTALQAAVEDGRITQDQADLMQARQAFRAYAQEQGLPDKVKALYEDAVQQAVEAGVLTRAQADAILAGSGPLGGLRGLPGPGDFGGMRGHGGFGGMRGPGEFGLGQEFAPR